MFDCTGDGLAEIRRPLLPPKNVIEAFPRSLKAKQIVETAREQAKNILLGNFSATGCF